MSSKDLECVEQKVRLRRRMLARRQDLSTDQVVKATESACERIEAIEVFRKAGTVALFAASRKELHAELLIERILRRGGRVVFPRVEGEGELSFRQVRDLEELSIGRFAIREPSAQAPRVSEEELDLVFVPGLAFSERGERLGYGGGYYDRTLLALRPDATTMGFCHDFQLTERIPTEAHDVRLQHVVTDLRHVRCVA